MGAFEITSFWGASLVSGRNTGNFLKNWALVDLSSRERKERQALTTKIPYAKDQGILTADQGSIREKTSGHCDRALTTPVTSGIAQEAQDADRDGSRCERQRCDLHLPWSRGANSHNPPGEFARQA